MTEKINPEPTPNQQPFPDPLGPTEPKPTIPPEQMPLPEPQEEETQQGEPVKDVRSTQEIIREMMDYESAGAEQGH